MKPLQCRGVVPNVLVRSVAGAALLLGSGCDRPLRETTPELPSPKPPNPGAQSNGPARPIPQGEILAEVAARALPAVVSVASTRLAKVQTPELPLDNPFFRRFFGPEGLPFPVPPGQTPEQRGLGSGVMVGNGIILTNAHVVEGATELEVTAENGKTITAALVGSDPKSDIAVLRIKGESPGLKPLEFADSSRVRPGQIVLAIGNPFGVGVTVTMGIISAKGRADLGIVDYEDFIQTDAAINPGNSGGALVDLDGRLIGIPTAILSRSGGYMGVGFAIPSNMAQPIMQSLLEHGRVARGYLGVSIQEIDRELAGALGLSSPDGVLIADVSAGAPAAIAGLRRGDVVVRLNEEQVRTTGQFRNLIANAGVGKTVKLGVIRGGKEETVEAKLGAMPDSEKQGAPQLGSSPGAGALGVSVGPLGPAERKRLAVPSSIDKGVVVVAVAPGTPAAAAGLRPGDVIVEVDKNPVGAPGELEQRWAKADGMTALLVFREGRTFYTTVKKP